MSTINWKVGDVVKLFDGAYSTGTIIKIDDEVCDVARPYLHAGEAGGWSVGVEVVARVRLARLVPAETNRDGQPTNMLHGCYTHDDLKKVARGEWKL